MCRVGDQQKFYHYMALYFMQNSLYKEAYTVWITVKIWLQRTIEIIILNISLFHIICKIMYDVYTMRYIAKRILQTHKRIEF